MRRYVLILGLLIAGSASAQAATLNHHDTGHHVFVGSKVASSFDAVTGSAEAPRDPWGHWGTYYGPMI
jgi:hypothetical protein